MTKIGITVCLVGALLVGGSAYAQTPDANPGAGQGDPLTDLGANGGNGTAKKKPPRATGYGQTTGYGRKFNEDIGYGQKQHRATGYGKQPKPEPPQQQPNQD